MTRPARRGRTRPGRTRTGSGPGRSRPGRAGWRPARPAAVRNTCWTAYPFSRSPRGDGDDLGDPPVPLPGAVAGGGGVEVDVDHDVDGGGDRAHGVVVGDVRAGLHGAGDQLADGAFGDGACVVEMDPAPDSIALSMARISWPRTSPTIWRDRLNRKESNRACGQGELAGLAPVRAALAGAGAGLPGEHDRVLLGQLVQVQLVLGLEGADRLVLGDLRAQGPHQGGLAGALGAGRRRCDLRALTAAARNDAATAVSVPQIDQVVQGDLAQPVPADHHRRARGHPGRGGQAGAAVQAQVQPGLGLGERAGVDLAARGQEDQEVDQLVRRCPPPRGRARGARRSARG